MNKYIEKAKQIIAENIYMTIATASTEGKPWVSPVFFAYDDSYNLYWVSNKDARHSKLINNNPKVSIVIFNSQAPEGDGDGVYFEGTAQALEDRNEIQSAMEVLNKRITKHEFSIKKIDEVTDTGLWRLNTMH